MQAGIEFSPLDNGDRSLSFHQATGMVSAQANCTVGHAILLIQQWAINHGQSLDEVAREVLDHEIRFDRAE